MSRNQRLIKNAEKYLNNIKATNPVLLKCYTNYILMGCTYPDEIQNKLKVIHANATAMLNEPWWYDEEF